MFINKLLHLIIIDVFSKIGNRQVVENLFPGKMIYDLLESHHSWKFGSKGWEKKSSGKNKIY